MYRRILVPMVLDHGISPKAIGIARALRAPGGEIIALHVYEAPQGSVRAYLDEEIVKASFEAARRRLEEKVSGMEGINAVIETGHTARRIIDHAGANGVDCIVIGSHKPGLRDFLLGSTAARVVRHAGCSVHVVRG